jgi:RNA polymerase-binding transcription factor DksA
MPLSPEQRRHLEARLKDERERARRIIASYNEALGVSEEEQSGDLSGYPLHLADEGTDTMQRELDAVLATRATSELEAIEAALRKFYAEPERFGICEDTGAEIAFERLDIVPWARTCRATDRD